MARRHRHTLFSVVEDNFGYVTVEQARAAGIGPEQLAQLARRGTLERCSYGVYRLTEFPVSELDPYMAAALWPHGVTGVISHDTALDLYDVCDVNPNKVHITVPRSHRVRRAVPGQYVLHHADLDASDVTGHEGIPITTLERAIADCIAAGLGNELILQAIDAGHKQGYLGKVARSGLRSALTARGRTGARRG
jgi:predicted transcriptional regulator of viral defense system